MNFKPRKKINLCDCVEFKKFKKCCVDGCESEGIEDFGDIDQKNLYCLHHASLVEMLVETDE